MKKILTAFILLSSTVAMAQQDINAVLNKAKIKIETVNDYEALGVMKTNVAFLKIPIAKVKIYFKSPNKLKLKSESGVSFVPKGAVSINLNNITGSQKFTVLDAGTDKIEGFAVRIAKLIPIDESSDLVISTIYIDETRDLILKTKTTTKENGTYELIMTYGIYATNGLPDKIIFSFNAKDYKLPKGITFDFDDGDKPVAASKNNLKDKKGKVEITFKNYVINKGVADNIFNEK